MNKVIKRKPEDTEIKESLSELRRLNSKLQHGTISEDELAHYGVIGMRWGIRRYQNSDGSLTARGRARLEQVYKNYKDDRGAQRQRATSYKQRRNLSDEQLRTTVQRLEAEKKLKSLVMQDLAPGRAWMSEQLLKFGGSAIGAAAGVIGAALAKEYLRKRGFPIGKGD